MKAIMRKVTPKPVRAMIKKVTPKRLRPRAIRIYEDLTTINLTRELAALEDQALYVLKCKVAYNKYGGYCVPLSSYHRAAAQAILSNDIWEPDTIEFMIKNCNGGDIVHAGTYFGDFLPALSKGVAPDAKIWAFEPNTDNYRCAKNTIEINNIKNTSLINAGLGSKADTLFIKTTVKGRALGGASQIITAKTSEEIDAEPVRIVTVDDIVEPERFVSIIQLDVEGYEKEALTGALKTIQRCHPIIILEVWPNSTFLDSDWFSTNILSLGYEKNSHIHDNVVYSCKPDNRT